MSFLCGFGCNYNFSRFNMWEVFTKINFRKILESCCVNFLLCLLYFISEKNNWDNENILLLKPNLRKRGRYLQSILPLFYFF